MVNISLKLQASEESVPWRACKAELVLHQNGANDGVSCKVKIVQMMGLPVKMRLIHFLSPELSKIILFKL